MSSKATQVSLLKYSSPEMKEKVEGILKTRREEEALEAAVKRLRTAQDCDQSDQVLYDAVTRAAEAERLYREAEASAANARMEADKLKPVSQGRITSVPSPAPLSDVDLEETPVHEAEVSVKPEATQALTSFLSKYGNSWKDVPASVNTRKFVAVYSCQGGVKEDLILQMGEILDFDEKPHTIQAIFNVTTGNDRKLNFVISTHNMGEIVVIKAGSSSHSSVRPDIDGLAAYSITEMTVHLEGWASAMQNNSSLKQKMNSAK